MRAGDQSIHLLKQRGRHAEGQQVEIDAVFIEQTQHHAFAVARRQGGDAHVDGASANAQRHATVLRNALFSDIKARHHLYARDQQRGEAALGAQDFAQYAVDAKANLQVAFIGFDMNIRCFLFDSLGEHGVNQADNRRVVFAIQQVVGVRQLFGKGVQIQLVADIRHHAPGLGGVALIAQHQQLFERLRFQSLEAERHPGHPAGFQQRLRRGGGEAENLAAFAVAQEHHVVRAGVAEGEQRASFSGGGHRLPPRLKASMAALTWRNAAVSWRG